ncbi:YlxR family protein [Fundidesulfovibrio butyratiphilus]
MTKKTSDTVKEGPVRTCVVCRKRLPKNELIRHVWRGEFAPDLAAVQPGRGYYCCAGESCREALPRRAAAVRKRKGKGEGNSDEA